MRLRFSSYLSPHRPLALFTLPLLLRSRRTTTRLTGTKPGKSIRSSFTAKSSTRKNKLITIGP